MTARSEKLERARALVIRDLLNQQEAAISYTIVSALFATSPFAEIVVSGEDGKTYRRAVDTLRILCSRTSMLSMLRKQH